MSRYAKDYSPTASDFEESVRKSVERDPNKEKIRGPSNDAGDDGLYRDASNGVIEVIECKHTRQDKAVPKKHVVGLANAIEKARELYPDATAVKGTLYTTSGSLTLPAKTAIKEVRRSGVDISVMCFDELKSMAASLPADDPERFALERALQVKARRFKG